MAEERAAFHMTECNQKVFSFASHFSRRVETSFTASGIERWRSAVVAPGSIGKIGLLKPRRLLH